MIRTINFLSSRKSVLFPLLLIIIFFGIGSLIYFDTAFIPGDLGDARFNMYVLEHGYRWLSGLEESFWSPSFFYPESMVLAFSDSHLGTLPLYALLRKTGLIRESAFLGWFIICSLLNFLSAYIVIKKMIYPSLFSSIASSMGAYYFTFGLPVIAQMNHAQLIPRFFVPIAFFALIRLFETRKVFYWYALILSITAQLYVSIYTGYFTILCTGFTFLAWLLYKGKTYLSKNNLMSIIKGIRLKILITTIMILLLLLPLAIPYFRISQITGGRNWIDISSMLPRIQSYFTAHNSFLWGNFLYHGGNIPMEHEHQLFIGLFPFLAILFSIIGSWKSRDIDPSRGKMKFFLTGLLFTVIFTLYYGSSLYRLVFWLPGANAIRAVTRIILIMLFPLAIILAHSVIKILEWTKRHLGPKCTFIAVLFLPFLLIIDQTSSLKTFSIDESINLVENIKNDFQQIEGKTVLWLPVDKGEPFYKSHITAMLAAQELGVPTINGYSGHFPPDYSQSLISGEGDYCEALKKWLYIKTWNLDKKFTMDEIGQVGTADKCNLKGAVTLLPLQEAGFDIWEGIPGEKCWAINKTASLVIPGDRFSQQGFLLEMYLETLITRNVEISVNGGNAFSVKLEPGRAQHVQVPVTRAERNNRIVFTTEQEGVVPDNGDPRVLFFCLLEVKVRAGSNLK